MFKNSHDALLSTALLTASLLAAASPVAATGSPVVPLGELEFDGGRGAFLERFDAPETLRSELLSVALGGELIIVDFPVEPGVRMPIIFQRVDPYAPGARVLLVDAEGQRELPRSSHHYVRGYSAVDPDVRIALSVAPEDGSFRGIARSHDRLHEIAPSLEKSASGHVIASSELLLPKGTPPLQTACGNDLWPELDDGAELEPLWAPFPEPLLTKATTSTPQYAAIIAFDTDQEWLYYRFTNNTSQAATWIADYINESNVMYERDLSLRLLIGDTILRTGSPPFTSDPYEDGYCYNPTTGQVSSTICLQSSDCSTGYECRWSPAGSAQLNEFGSYWSSNYGSVDRVFAQLLSGKSSSDYSSSGIAWLDGYCEYQSSGGGYSVFQPFKASAISVISSLRVGAHELGHNFNSPHTHCYVPRVDDCYIDSCFAGPVSCPAATGGSGTMMSYCHMPAPKGANCGPNLIQFHPTVISRIDGFRASHTPWYILELLFSDGFEGGNTNAWSASQP